MLTAPSFSCSSGSPSDGILTFFHSTIAKAGVRIILIMHPADCAGGRVNPFQLIFSLFSPHNVNSVGFFWAPAKQGRTGRFIRLFIMLTPAKELSQAMKEAEIIIPGALLLSGCICTFYRLATRMEVGEGLCCGGAAWLLRSGTVT